MIGLTGDVTRSIEIVCIGVRTEAAPTGRRSASRRRTSITPVSSVKRVDVSPPRRVTSAITTVPRMPATALGVRSWMDSPGRMRSFATASAIFPDSTSTVETRGESVMVTTERSRTVITALPPSRMRASDCSPVTMRSCSMTGSRNFSARGAPALARVTVAVPDSAVTTPAGGAVSAQTGAHATRAAASAIGTVRSVCNSACIP